MLVKTPNSLVPNRRQGSMNQHIYFFLLFFFSKDFFKVDDLSLEVDKQSLVLVILLSSIALKVLP